MRRAPLAVVVGVLALGCAVAFFGGGELQTHVLAKARPEPGSAAAGFTFGSDNATAASFLRSSSSPGMGRLGTAFSTALRSHAAQNAPAQAYVETAEQREERHRAINQNLTDTLGAISPEKRAALVELNDEATQVQYGLQAAVLGGSLSEADYDAEIHQRIVVQLDQLHSMVTDDEYRKLTGLQPGVDPYEYMRTGIGGVPKADSGKVAVADDPTPTGER